MALGNVKYDVPDWVGKPTRNMSKNQRGTMAAVRAAIEAAAANPVNAMGQNSLTPQMAAQAFQNPLMPSAQGALPAAGQTSQALSQLPVGRVNGAIPLGSAPEAAARSVNMMNTAPRAAMSSPAATGAMPAAARAAAGLGDDAVRGAATGAQAYQAAKAAAGGGRFAGVRAGVGAAAKANPVGLAAGLAGVGLGAMWNDPNSRVDDAASWGLQGAGFGSMAGPWGAAIGGLGGSALGYMMAGDAEADANALTRELTTQRTKLTRILEQSGASSDFVQQAQTQLDLMAMNVTSKDQIGPLMEQLTGQLMPAVAGDQQQQATERMRAANMAAMQSWMGPMMQDALNRQQYYADQSGDALRRTASQFQDPTLREAGNSVASRTSLNAANSAAAQLQQLAAAPGVMGMYTGMDQYGMQPQDLASLAGATQIPAGQDYLSMLLAGQ